MSGCSKVLIGLFCLALALTMTLTAELGEGSEGGVLGRYLFGGVFWLLGICLILPWGRAVTGRLAAGGVGGMLIFFNILMIRDGDFNPVAFLWGFGGICALIYAFSGELPEVARQILGGDEDESRRKRKKKRRRPKGSSGDRPTRKPPPGQPPRRRRRPPS